MIAITGATGKLGQLVIQSLIQRGVDPKTIIAVVRNKSKAQDLVSKGVELREGDYSRPETLEKAFAGVDKLLLISGTDLGTRIPQHTNVVNAAKKAQVQFIAYTSLLKADTSKMNLAAEHLATEKIIQASGIPYAFLRNSWYIENYTEQFGNVLASGVIAGSAKDGKVSAASRADYADAAAAVLIDNKKPNATYELGGPAFTLTQLASLTSELSGKKIEYKDMPASAYEKMLVGFGLPAPVAQMLADSDEGIARGDLWTESNDLKNLIGRAPAALDGVVKKALAQ